MAESDNATTQTRPTISVGQPLDEAKNLLSVAGAENITNSISTFVCYPEGQARRELHFFRLRNGVWLCIQVVEVGEPKRFIIDELVLGDNNADNINKRELSKYQSIISLEIG